MSYKISEHDDEPPSLANNFPSTPFTYMAKSKKLFYILYFLFIINFIYYNSELRFFFAAVLVRLNQHSSKYITL